MIFGTFSEQSFPLEPAAIVRVPPISAGASAREWLVAAHASLRQLLPAGSAPALLTSDLTRPHPSFSPHPNPLPPGEGVDVWKHFGVSADRVGSLRTNWEGITHTAQSAGAGAEGEGAPEPWPGFEDAWVPGYDGLPLAARLGWATDGAAVREADVIVILPGLLGDNRVLRTRDLAIGLKSCGFHVLALELRGHGQTDRRTPESAYTFSALETLDLLALSRGLKAQPHVRRTGLIGFCWGANHALCTAWYDGCGGVHPGIGAGIAAQMPPMPDERHYDAGVMAFSPVLRFEELLDKLDVKRSRFREPVLAGLQGTVMERMTRKGYPEPSGSLRRLISAELHRSRLKCPTVEEDAYRYVRMLPYHDQADDEKLESVRTPTLIVHAANDPMAPSQDVADLFAKTTNPLVGGIILPGGGHIGFGAYAKDYYYSLIVNFFERSML